MARSIFFIQSGATLADEVFSGKSSKTLSQRPALHYFDGDCGPFPSENEARLASIRAGRGPIVEWVALPREEYDGLTGGAPLAPEASLRETLTAIAEGGDEDALTDALEAYQAVILPLFDIEPEAEQVARDEAALAELATDTPEADPEPDEEASGDVSTGVETPDPLGTADWATLQKWGAAIRATDGWEDDHGNTKAGVIALIEDARAKGVAEALAPPE